MRIRTQRRRKPRVVFENHFAEEFFVGFVEDVGQEAKVGVGEALLHFFDDAGADVLDCDIARHFVQRGVAQDLPESILAEDLGGCREFGGGGRRRRELSLGPTTLRLQVFDGRHDLLAFLEFEMKNDSYLELP